MSKQIVIVGAGTMGRVIASALQTSHETHQLTLLRRDTSRTTVNWSHIDVVFLAVKPQDVAAAVADLPQLTKQLVISVMAGISTQTIQTLTGAQRIIRCMPNTPASIGQGMTVWFKTPSVTGNDAVWFTTVLQHCGKLLEVTSDDWIDKATAISASGPAYVFAQAEAVVAAAAQLGFSAEQARLLVSQTWVGAAALLAQSTEPVAELRQQVTSQGGTTAAAAQVLAESGFDDIWKKAIQAAYARAKELSQRL